MNRPIQDNRRERGSGLIVVIMVVAFMLAVGMLLLTVTGTSPKASDSLRLQGLAFDAAEAGFNAAWAVLNDGFNSGLYYVLRRPVPVDFQRGRGAGRPDPAGFLLPRPDRRADRPGLHRPTRTRTPSSSTPSRWPRTRAARSRSSSSTTRRPTPSPPTTTTASSSASAGDRATPTSAWKSSSRWGPETPRKGIRHETQRLEAPRQPLCSRRPLRRRPPRPSSHRVRLGPGGPGLHRVHPGLRRGLRRRRPTRTAPRASVAHLDDALGPPHPGPSLPAPGLELRRRRQPTVWAAGSTSARPATSTGDGYPDLIGLRHHAGSTRLRQRQPHVRRSGLIRSLLPDQPGRDRPS
ncbi:MAG: pilus assembly PilX N-terminal domain-containing protein [Comamonadaceae bacterium]|nr:pilus assembly PilX N-terminal domain-containing protein [Comamonadaceae bacterium]